MLIARVAYVCFSGNSFRFWDSKSVLSIRSSVSVQQGSIMFSHPIFNVSYMSVFILLIVYIHAMPVCLIKDIFIFINL